MSEASPRVPRFHPRTLALAATGLAVVVLVAAVAFAALQEPLAPAGADGPSVSKDEGDSFDALDGTDALDRGLLDASGRVDSDNDGLPDATENYVTGSDPRNWSSSGGPIPDGWLHQFGYDPLLPGIDLSAAAAPPADVVPLAYGPDGRSVLTPSLWDVYSFDRPADWDEAEDGPFQNGLDPRDWDQNDDGIPDGFLLPYDLDPRDALAEQRLGGSGGFTVREAFEHNTDPTRLDTDGDGIADTVEVRGGPLADGFTFPPTDPARFDSNGAGVCDGFLAHQGIDPNDPAAARGDADLDGATAVEEFQWSLDAYGAGACTGETGLRLDDATSGSSTIPDGWLIKYGLDPLEPGIDAKVTQKASTDPGPDAPAGAGDLELTVLDEYLVNRPSDWDEATQGPWWGGTDPTKDDTDGDGLGDAWELRGYTVAVSTDVGPTAEATDQTVLPDPTRADTDGDGLPDGKEADPGDDLPPSDATRRDTDLDGLSDQFEAADADLDPLKADSAKDFLRDGDRYLLLAGRAEAYKTDVDYDCPGSCLWNDALEWLSKTEGAQDLLPVDAADATALVGPDGDLDGDDVRNLVDPDVDGDGLLNGHEVDPATYVQSAFGLGPLGARPATDPLNRDTDGDLLVDAWEVQYGVAAGSGPAAGRYDPDPSDWDTDGDDTSDGDEDPDDDGTVWYAYTVVGDRTEAQANEFAYTNLMEQQYGTHPRDPTSDDDQLRDGWKVFWGSVYPFTVGPDPAQRGDLFPQVGGVFSLPADVPAPAVGAPQTGDDATLGSVQTTRFTDSAIATANALPHEFSKDPVYQADGRSIVEVVGVRPYTFQDAQEYGTNPYMVDSDGDGMSDAWEVAYAEAPPDDDCGPAVGPRPATHDADADPDGDGLTNLEEHDHGVANPFADGRPAYLHPLCADHDHGGVDDGDELTWGYDPAFPSDDLDDDQDLDQDHDGLSDVEEFRDRGTDPADPDTDGDGLLDGPNQPENGGYDRTSTEAVRFLQLGIAFQVLNDDTLQFLGEDEANGDPLEADPFGVDVPHGWIFARSITDPTSDPAGVRTAYAVGMPSWWDHALHGPWWGGAASAAEAADAPALAAQTDLDADGLHDRDGEDPMPGNHDNVPAAVDTAPYESDLVAAPTVTDDPRDAGLTALERRLSAQAWLSPAQITPQGLARDLDAADRNADADHQDRTQPTLTAALAPGTGDLDKGTPFDVLGTLTSDTDGDGDMDPVPGATVVATLDGQIVGLAVTDAAGAYELVANVAGQGSLALPADPAPFSVLGERSGTVAYEADTAAVDLGSNTLQLRSYPTPRNTPHTDQWPPVEAATASVPVTLKTASQLALDAPEAVTAGGSFVVTVTVADGAGDPLDGTVELTTPDGPLPTRDLVDGSTQFLLGTTLADAGAYPLEVDYLPDDANVQDATQARSVDVLLATTLTLDPLPATVRGGQPFTATGHLDSDDGDVSGAPVTLTAGSVEAATTTGPDGRFQVSLTVAEDQDPGSLLVLAAADPTATTEADGTSRSTQVLARPVLVDQSPPSIRVGEPVPIQGFVRGPDGSPVVGGTVRYDLGGKTGVTTTGSDGTFSEDVAWNPPAGPVLQTLTYVEDGTYAERSVQTERYPLSDVTLTATSGEVARGAPLEVDVTLVDALGDPLAGARVDALLDDGTETGRTDTQVTDAAGTATLVLPTLDLPLGLHEVLVSYAGSGDGSLQPAETTVAPWNVVSALEVRLPDGPFVAGDEPPEPALVDAGTGAAVVRTLTLAPVEDGVAGTASTVTPRADGTFDLFGAFPASTEPQTYRWKVAFAGDDAYPAFEQELKVPVLLPVSVDARLDRLPVAGDPANLLVEVLAPGGEVGSGNVTVLLDDEQVGFSALRNGRASIQLFPDEAGPTDLRVLYDGSLRHGPAEHREELLVLSPTELDVTVAPLAGGDALVQVTATGADGPLAFRTVHLSVEGYGGFDVETDGDGVARLTVVDADENLTVSARLDAQAGEEPTLATANVGAAAPAASDFGLLWTLLVWLAVVAVLVALALLAARLFARRSPLEKELLETLRTVRGKGPAEEVILHAYYVLQRAALRREWMTEEAATPRTLQETLHAQVPRMPDRPLDDLIALFEAARYSNLPMQNEHRLRAYHAVQAIRRATAWGGRA